MRPDDSGVAGVVGGLLLLSAVVAFLVTLNFSWVPVWIENSENLHTVEMQDALASWADSAEDHVARELFERTFVRTIPVGMGGLPLFGKGAAPGEVTLTATPTVEVWLDGSQRAIVTGGLVATTATTQTPAPTYRYIGGVLELDQGGASWADTRNLVSAQRATGGKLTVAVAVLGLTGGPESTGSGSSVAVSGLPTAGSQTSEAAGDVRIVASGIEAGAWRQAINRTLGGESLVGEWSATCATSTRNFCFDSAANDSDSLDVRLRNVGAGWDLTYGRIAVEVGT